MTFTSPSQGNNLTIDKLALVFRLSFQITIENLLSLSSGLEDNEAFNPFQISELDGYQLAPDSTALFPASQDFI